MFSRKKMKIIFGLVLLISFLGITTNLIFANRITGTSPDPITYTIEEPTDMTFLQENSNFKYYFRDSRDVLAVYDKRNEVTHLTGLDVPYSSDIRWDCDDALFYGDEDLIADECIPIEDRLNEIYINFANSLVTIEYFDENYNILRASSADAEEATSRLSKLDNNDHWALDVEFESVDVTMRVHIYFSLKGFELDVISEEIIGEDRVLINSIILAPFLDAQGGKVIPFDGEDYDRDNIIDKDANDGYIFVPDGSGALLRFKQNDVSISNYTSYVYGRDVTATMTANNEETLYLSPKLMTLPVFGISIGDDTDAAFIAYATSGDEYMKVDAYPHNNKTWYNYAYASFLVNETFWQTLSSGDGVDGFSDSRDSLETQNYRIQYQFLAGDGTIINPETGEADGLPASYVGMALAYKDYLESIGLGDTKSGVNQDISLRLDFLMSDVKKDLFGYEDVVVTKLDDVETIYDYFNEAGISNINSGLLGYRSGGITACRVGDSKVSNSIGGKNGMNSLLEKASLYGYDVSFTTDYGYINELQYSPIFNVSPAKHINGRYYEFTILDYQTISVFNLLRTDRALDWLASDVAYSEGLDMSSVTIDGISNTLFSEYRRDLSRLDNKELIINGVMEIENLMINAVNPNAYLLPYVDRYLDAPLYSSHFLIETDAVPFLQLVLSSNMEMYASYANFNLTTYEDYLSDDILRMIDYNVYPSFILTEEPSYQLVDTNSFIYYSTQFDFYDEEIVKVYSDINMVLKQVHDADWIGRTVITEGVIKNSYSNGIDVYINYNDTQYEDGIFVDANSYLVIDNG